MNLLFPTFDFFLLLLFGTDLLFMSLVVLAFWTWMANAVVSSMGKSQMENVLVGDVRKSFWFGEVAEKYTLL